MKKILLFLFILFYKDVVAQNKFTTFGFSYVLKNKNESSIEILEVINKSDASLKGLQSGDEILQINSIIVNDVDNTEIEKEIFASKDKGIMTLKIERLTSPIVLKTTEIDMYECLYGDCNNGKGKRRNNRAFIEEEGVFKNGQLYGKDGTVMYIGKTKRYFPNLFTKQTGEYFEGNLLVGKTYYPNGSIHQGRVKNGYPFGNGAYTDQDGNIYTGEFTEKGILADGTIATKDNNGNIVEKKYKNGAYVTAPVVTAPVKKNAVLYGYINNKGSLLIPLKYKNAGSFSEGLAIAQTQNDELVIIDKKGKETPIKNKAYAAAFLNGTGFIFSEGLCAVATDKKYGFINAKGEDVIACEYERPLTSNNSDLRTVREEPKFENGVAVIFKNGLYGVIDKTGKIVVPIEYQFLTHFKNNLAVFQKNLSVPNTKGVMDINGYIIVKPKMHENIWIEDNNIIRYHYLDGSWSNFYGFYNNKGEDNKESHFEYLSKFENGVALYGTKKNPNFWGILNASGAANPLKDAYAFDLNEPWQFKNGQLYATKISNKKMVLLNNNGNRVNNNCEYDLLYEVNDGIAFGTKGTINASFYNEKGCNLIYETDLNGEKRMNYIFSSISKIHSFIGGYAAIKKDGSNYNKKQWEYILIDKTGKTTYSVLGGTDCSLTPSKTEAGIFLYNEIDIYNFLKPRYTLFLNGNGTVLYKAKSTWDFNDGMAAVSNWIE